MYQILVIDREKTLKQLSDPEVIDSIRQVAAYIEEKGEDARRYVVFPGKGNEIVLEEGEITYIERENRTTRIYMENGQNLEIAWKLTDVMEQLDADRFVRCHNSFIINFEQIRLFGRAEFEMRDGERIPISRSRYREVKEKFENWKHSYDVPFSGTNSI